MAVADKPEISEITFLEPARGGAVRRRSFQENHVALRVLRFRRLGTAGTFGLYCESVLSWRRFSGGEWFDARLTVIDPSESACGRFVSAPWPQRESTDGLASIP